MTRFINGALIAFLTFVASAAALAPLIGPVSDAPIETTSPVTVTGNPLMPPGKLPTATLRPPTSTQDSTFEPATDAVWEKNGQGGRERNEHARNECPAQHSPHLCDDHDDDDGAEKEKRGKHDKDGEGRRDKAGEDQREKRASWREDNQEDDDNRDDDHDDGDDERDRDDEDDD